MPGETKIFKDSSGWYDVDKPGVYYTTRAFCRDARRGGLPSRALSVPRSPSPISVTVQNITTSPVDGSPLTSLQQRLLDRLIQSQGVSINDALAVVSTNGYNKAASYGHMREAGANHAEALVVIGLDSPDISVAYGKARAVGEEHTDALMVALRDTSDWAPVDDD